MSNFVHIAYDMRTALIFCYHLKKTQQNLNKCCGSYALTLATCKRWIQLFWNNDFDVRNEERGRPPKQFKDTEFQELLDDNYWTVNAKRYQKQLIDLNRAL